MMPAKPSRMGTKPVDGIQVPKLMLGQSLIGAGNNTEFVVSTSNAGEPIIRKRFSPPELQQNRWRKVRR